MHADLPLILEIRLVGDDEDGEEILVLDPEDLLVELGDLLERVPRGDGVDKEETFTRSHVPVGADEQGVSELIRKRVFAARFSISKEAGRGICAGREGKEESMKVAEGGGSSSSESLGGAASAEEGGGRGDALFTHGTAEEKRKGKIVSPQALER